MNKRELQNRIVDRVSAEQNVGKLFALMTDAEVVTINAYMQYGSLRAAARNLGCSSRAVDQVVQRLRKKYSTTVKWWDGDLNVG